LIITTFKESFNNTHLFSSGDRGFRRIDTTMKQNFRKQLDMNFEKRAYNSLKIPDRLPKIYSQFLLYFQIY
jgi:hypothetical protein